MKEYILAKDIHECEECPLYKSECMGGCSTSDGGGNPIEPPCCGWKDDDKIYDGMIEDAWLIWEIQKEELKKAEKRIRANKSVETRKKYKHLNKKYEAFSKWLSQSSWHLIITSRRKDRVYMRELGKRRANYFFNLEKEVFCPVQGNISLADKTVINKFENDFKEFYYGERPEDRDFVKEYNEHIISFINMLEGRDVKNDKL